MNKSKRRPYWSSQQSEAAGMQDEDEEKGVICKGCGLRKARLRFSNVQWTQYQSRKYQALSRRGGAKKIEIETPYCRQCNGEPAMDKRCTGCEKVLPLDKFSKNARKNKDNAKCINCTQNWEDLEADPHAAVKEQEYYDHLENERGASSAWTFKSMGTTLISDLGSRAGYDTVSNTGTNPRTENHGVWIRDDRRRDNTSNRIRSSDSVSNDSDGTRQSPSATGTAQTNGSWAAFTPIEQGHHQRKSSTTASTTTGFAKQQAYRPDMHTRVENKWANDKAKRHDADDEVDESDSSDDDDDDSEHEL